MYFSVFNLSTHSNILPLLFILQPHFCFCLLHSLSFIPPLKTPPRLPSPALVPFESFISVQRQSLSASINTAIQRSLHAGTADPEALLYLLDTYSACLTHSAQTSRTNGSGALGAVGKDGVGDDYATMSIPDLLTWVREEACSSSSSSTSSSPSPASMRPEVQYMTISNRLLMLDCIKPSLQISYSLMQVLLRTQSLAA